MTTYTAPVPSYDLPLGMSDRADASNAALRAGYESKQAALAAWAMVKEAFPGSRTSDQWSDGERVARRLAVSLEQAVRRTYGLVSNSACGLVGVTQSGRVGEVEDTTSGDDYLDGVQWIEFDGKQWTNGRKDECPVSEFVVFFDTREQAQEFLYPTPRPSHPLLGRRQA